MINKIWMLYSCSRGMFGITRLRLKLIANCFPPPHWYERYVEVIKGYDP